MNAIELKEIHKKFRLPWKRKSLVAVESLDLTIKKGEIFGLLGPNGSGKTTTFKILLGLIQPTRGTASVFDKSAGTLEARALLGFLPENPYFPRNHTGREVLRYYGGVCGLQGSALETRIKTLLDLVRLATGSDRPLHTYSKGMLQRLGLAQALLQDPPLLLLDEPTSGVDPIGAREMKELLLRLKSEGKTILFSSHLLDQVEEVADRIAILYSGKKILEGHVTDLLTDTGRTQILTSGLSPDQLPRALEAIRSLGATEAVASPVRQTLENLFIKNVL